MCDPPLLLDGIPIVTCKRNHPLNDNLREVAFPEGSRHFIIWLPSMARWSYFTVLRVSVRIGSVSTWYQVFAENQ